MLLIIKILQILSKQFKINDEVKNILRKCFKSEKEDLLFFFTVMAIVLFLHIMFKNSIQANDNYEIKNGIVEIEKDEIGISYVGFQDKNNNITIKDKDKVVYKITKIDNGQSGFAYEISVKSNTYGLKKVEVYKKITTNI